MQYAVARVEGIFARGGIDRSAVRREVAVTFTDPRERALALELVRFSETLEDVEADARPNLLSSWLFDVAGAYSTFYDALSVLKAEGDERATRLALCDLTGRSLRTGLELLGIQVPERM
jgi:arginyl-tRNA synthetase